MRQAVPLDLPLPKGSSCASGKVLSISRKAYNRQTPRPLFKKWRTPNGSASSRPSSARRRRTRARARGDPSRHSCTPRARLRDRAHRGPDLRLSQEERHRRDRHGARQGLRHRRDRGQPSRPHHRHPCRHGRPADERRLRQALGEHGCRPRPLPRHDGHTTWLLGAARWLAAHNDFPGRIVLVHQAAEEAGTGAKALVEAGLIEKYGIEEIYGGHTEPNLPKGVIGFKPGPLQAASDSVYITLRGKGTHGGRPHLGVDPIPVAAQIVTALQTIVSRKVDPIESAVVSICSINCGNFKANNVVQSELTMSGTVRTFLPEIRDLAEENIRAMVTGIATANGCTVELVYDRMIGSVINGEEQTIAAHEVTKALLGEDNVRIIRPFMSSEDFSEYLNRIPGAIIRVGIRDEEHQVSLHNQQMDFNDEVLPVAVSVVANMAVRRLEALAAR
ncbi:MAG: amidohydrolase [Sutterella wadsworthensis]